MAQPTKIQTAKFLIKSRLLQQKRLLQDTLTSPVKRFPKANGPAPEDFDLLAEHTSTLWNTENPLEQDLTAGKVQNLRMACKAVNGVKVPANQVFSFWKHIGKTKSTKGYVVGRELREGCIIPTMGGGICQFSNALYDAALKADLEIVERHAHSQVIEGSLASRDRDATVFWNYVDLRFKASQDIQLEVKLTKDQLVLRIYGKAAEQQSEDNQTKPEVLKPVEHIGNCYSCGVSSCFRNKQQTEESVRFGKTAALVDAYFPEFDAFLDQRLTADDHFFSPINSKLFKAHAYRWNLEKKPNIKHATLIALRRALKLRKIPKQGRALQSALLSFEKKLAEQYARKLDFTVSHVIVSQNLLPHLWKTGALGGRTFDVLANRLPLKVLQQRLDLASASNPKSTSLGDFRVDSELVELEQEALAHANKIISPHRDITKLFGSRAEVLDWQQGPSNIMKMPSQTTDIFFPASALGRKGIFEVVDALAATQDALPKKPTLHILGRADEYDACPVKGSPKIQWKYSTGPVAEAMGKCQLVILPAYVEHAPRLLLKALEQGIPVIATAACGLPPQSGLTIIDNPRELTDALAKHFASFEETTNKHSGETETQEPRNRNAADSSAAFHAID